MLNLRSSCYPMTVNKMFALAESWVTTVTKRTESGIAVTFMTALEWSHKKKTKKPGR